MFKRDPSPLLPLLEKLKADPSLYVRKSVANNLNDIAKDHPDIVIATARRWLGSNANTNWIVRHGCRSLIRKADPEIMELFGYAPEESGTPLVSSAVLTADPAVLRIGEHCELQYALTIREGGPVRIRIEYGINFVKAGRQDLTQAVSVIRQNRARRHQTLRYTDPPLGQPDYTEALSRRAFHSAACEWAGCCRYPTTA